MEFSLEKRDFQLENMARQSDQKRREGGVGGGDGGQCGQT